MKPSELVDKMLRHNAQKLDTVCDGDLRAKLEVRQRALHKLAEHARLLDKLIPLSEFAMFN